MLSQVHMLELLPVFILGFGSKTSIGREYFRIGSLRALAISSTTSQKKKIIIIIINESLRNLRNSVYSHLPQMCFLLCILNKQRNKKIKDAVTGKETNDGISVKPSSAHSLSAKESPSSIQQEIPRLPAYVNWSETCFTKIIEEMLWDLGHQSSLKISVYVTWNTSSRRFLFLWGNPKFWMSCLQVVCGERGIWALLQPLT